MSTQPTQPTRWEYKLLPYRGTGDIDCVYHFTTSTARSTTTSPAPELHPQLDQLLDIHTGIKLARLCSVR